MKACFARKWRHAIKLLYVTSENISWVILLWLQMVRGLVTLTFARLSVLPCCQLFADALCVGAIYRAYLRPAVTRIACSLLTRVSRVRQAIATIAST